VLHVEGQQPGRDLDGTDPSHDAIGDLDHAGPVRCDDDLGRVLLHDQSLASRDCRELSTAARATGTTAESGNGETLLALISHSA
jgi:hypothetical protein